MEYLDQLKQLVEISSFAGNRVDYTQGGGGNTSVKLNDKLMAIKASGYKLSQITTDSGFVTVDYAAVKDYYSSVDLSDTATDFEKQSTQVHAASVTPINGMPQLRPSVEVGFHSFLKKYVIHIHSAYAAIIVCSFSGEDVVARILKDKDYGFIFIPYINPGFTLTHVMRAQTEKYQQQHGKMPDAIFMINHGLVVHSDDMERAMHITEDINREICAYYGISEKEFDKIDLQKQGDDKYVSRTLAVLNFAQKHGLNADWLHRYPLYPDQLVYLNNALTLSLGKVVFENNSVTYNCAHTEAVTLEETMAAFLFTLDKLLQNPDDISVMQPKDVDFINNWEAEKFRRSVAK